MLWHWRHQAIQMTGESAQNSVIWNIINPMKKSMIRYLHKKIEEETHLNWFLQIVDLSERYYSIARPFILGNSLGGQPLIGLRISKDVRQERQLLKPMVRLVANIHGNEATGREILLNLGQHLLMAYGIVRQVTLNGTWQFWKPSIVETNFVNNLNIDVCFGNLGVWTSFEYSFGKKT